jgi:hypothetical protein
MACKYMEYRKYVIILLNFLQGLTAEFHLIFQGDIELGNFCSAHNIKILGTLF